MEGRLLAVFLECKAATQSRAVAPAVGALQASKAYRQVLADYSCELLPLWHAIELLVFRAHSAPPTDLVWCEFTIALSAFYRKYFLKPQRGHQDPVRLVLAREYGALDVEPPFGDLRSADQYRGSFNRWRQLAGSQTRHGDLKAVFGGVDYDRLVAEHSLDWLEQTILLLTFYEERIPVGDWEAFYSLVDSCSPSGDPHTLPSLVRLVFSGKLLTSIANLPECYPHDTLWFSCHITDLLYLDTSAWLDPALAVERPLNEHFAELYADALIAKDPHRFFFIALEYYGWVGGKGPARIKSLLGGVPADDARFRRCLEIADAGFPGLREDLYQKLVHQHRSDTKRAMLYALESGIPSIVDRACYQVWAEHGDAADLGIEADLVDCSPYPLLQLTLDYLEFKALLAKPAGGHAAEAVSLLSNIIIHRRLPAIILQRILHDVTSLNLLEGPLSICLDAMYKLLEDLDGSEVCEKRVGRLALLRGISQRL